MNGTVLRLSPLKGRFGRHRIHINLWHICLSLSLLIVVRIALIARPSQLLHRLKHLCRLLVLIHPIVSCKSIGSLLLVASHSFLLELHSAGSRAVIVHLAARNHHRLTKVDRVLRDLILADNRGSLQ